MNNLATTLPIFYKRWFWLTVLGIILFIFFVYISYNAIKYPLAIDVNENFILNQVKVLLQNKSLSSIYPPLAEEPYLANPYPPVFQALEAGLISLFHLDLGNYIGRIISLVSALVAGFSLFWLIRKISNSYYAVLGALSLLLSRQILLWALMNRVDMLGLALTLIGVCLATAKRQLYIWLSLPFFILAFYTKVSFLAAPLALMIYLFIKKQKNFAFLYGAVYGFFIIGIFAVLNKITQGQFYVHIFTINANQYYYWSDVYRIVELLGLWPIVFLLVPASAYLYYIFVRKSIKITPGSPELFYVIYLILTLFTLFTYARAGAGLNYAFEFQAVLTVVAIFTCYKLFSSDWQPIVLFFKKEKILVALFVVLNLLILRQGISYLLYVSIDDPYANLYSKIKVLGRINQQHGGDFFEEYMNFSPQAPGRWYLSDARIFIQLASHQVWDQSKFVSKIKNQEFKIMVLDSYPLDDRKYYWRYGDSTLTNEMIKAMKENYRLDEVIGKHFLYYPKK